MAIKEFEIGPQNYFEEDYFSGDYTQSNVSRAFLECDIDNIKGGRVVTGLYFEDNYIDGTTFHDNSIRVTLTADAMVVQEAQVGLGSYIDDGYYQVGYFQQSGSFFTLTAELERFGIIVEATALLESQFTQAVVSNKLLETAADLNAEATQTTINFRIVQGTCDFESLFAPSMTADVIKNTFAVLDSTAALATVANANRSADIALASIINQSAQGMRIRDYVSAPASEFTQTTTVTKTIPLSAELTAEFAQQVLLGIKKEFVVDLGALFEPDFEVNAVTNTFAVLETTASIVTAASVAKVTTSNIISTVNLTTTGRKITGFAAQLQANFFTPAPFGNRVRRVTSTAPAAFSQTTNDRKVFAESYWNTNFSANKVAIDESRNSYYVNTGTLTKLNHNGFFLWSKQFNTLNPVDVAGIAEDAVVLGSSSVSGKIAVARLNKNGTIVWQRDITTSMQAENINIVKNTIYVTAKSQNSATIIKINLDGQIVWNKYVESQSLIDPVKFNFTSSTVDSEENTVLHFTRKLGTGESSADIVKVNNLGNIVWTRRITYNFSTQNLDDNFSKKIISDNSNYYLSGTGRVGQRISPYVLAINSSNGQTLFANSLTTAVDNSLESFTYISVDSDVTMQGFYLSATRSGSPTFNFYLKGNAQGQELWRKDYQTLDLAAQLGREDYWTTSADRLPNTGQYLPNSQLTTQPVWFTNSIEHLNNSVSSTVDEFVTLSNNTVSASVTDAANPQIITTRLSDYWATLIADPLTVSATFTMTPNGMYPSVADAVFSSAFFQEVYPVKTARTSINTNSNFATVINATVVQVNSAELVVNATLQTEPNKITGYAAALNSQAQLNSIAAIFKDNSASLSASIMLTAQPYDFTKATADLDTVTTVDADAYDFTKASADILSSSELTANAYDFAKATADLDTVSVVECDNLRVRFADAELPSIATKVTASIRRRSDVADLDAEFALTAQATTVSAFNVEISSEFTQTATVVKTTDITKTLTVTATLDSTELKTATFMAELDTEFTQQTVNARLRNNQIDMLLMSDSSVTAVKTASAISLLVSDLQLELDYLRRRPFDAAISSLFIDTVTAVKTVDPELVFESIATNITVGNVIAFDSALTLVIPREYRTIEILEESLFLTVPIETRVNMVRKT
jgi:hypothetical protein